MHERCLNNTTFISTPAYQAASVIASSVFFITALMNLGIILLFVTHRFLRNFSEALIVNLAVADLLTALIATVKTFPWDFVGKGPWSCYVMLVMIYMCCNMSLFGMTSISLERYCIVTLPLKCHTLKTRRNLCVMTITPWAIVFLLFAVPLFVFADIKRKETGYGASETGQCYSPFHDRTRPGMIIYETLSLLIPLMVLVCFNLLICRKLPKPAASRSKSTNTIQSPSVQKRSVNQIPGEHVVSRMKKISLPTLTVPWSDILYSSRCLKVAENDEEIPDKLQSQTGDMKNHKEANTTTVDKSTVKTETLSPCPLPEYTSKDRGSKYIQKECNSSKKRLNPTLCSQGQSTNVDQPEPSISSHHPPFSENQSTNVDQPKSSMPSHHPHRVQYADGMQQDEETNALCVLSKEIRESNTGKNYQQSKEDKRIMGKTGLYESLSKPSTSGSDKLDKKRKTEVVKSPSLEHGAFHSDMSSSFPVRPREATDLTSRGCGTILHLESSMRSNELSRSRSDTLDHFINNMLHSHFVSAHMPPIHRSHLSGHILLFLLTLSTLVSWLPYIVGRLIEAICIIHKEEGRHCFMADPCHLARHITLWVLYVQSTCNPMLYAFFHRNFRAALVNLRRKYFKRNSGREKSCHICITKKGS